MPVCEVALEGASIDKSTVDKSKLLFVSEHEMLTTAIVLRSSQFILVFRGRIDRIIFNI